MHEVILIAGLFSIFLFLPFALSFIELFLKRDAKPIPIDLEYKKDPDYFTKRFVNLLNDALKNLNIQELKEPTPIKLELNKEEWIVFPGDRILTEKTIDTPIVLTKDTVFLQKHVFKKELAVLGNAVFAEKCLARALYVKGDCVIEAPVRIARWVHVEGTLIVNSNADLGVSVYAHEIKIRGWATFKRAYAQKIDTLDEPLIDKKNNKERVINLQGNFGITGNITIGGEKGPIFVNGNIFCDGDVEIEGDVWIKGDVFSQKSITLKNGVVVGEEGKVKSVVARGEILIEGPFRIYGYLHSEKGVEVSI
ncbi:polymer-forming cytoskeletal protein [Thermocrinis sp.]|jgi:cytoskeletal protein CcmA (bactofilin family)|uniref:polymer-forming cytoskeletal protein n=1 Tax=Thermocrinis sp. TaxID=2024383 RepID=UPI00260F28BF|nr:polymer-forming cytoskeletal protein [Thermocrinis sp.]